MLCHDIVKLSVGLSRRLGERLPAPVPANPQPTWMKGQRRGEEGHVSVLGLVVNSSELVSV
jgi:hypothetical protein